MLAKEMGVILTKHAEMMTAKHWTELIQQLEHRGLYVVLQTNTNCRVLSPLGGLMPMPCKSETLNVMTAEELQAKGLTVNHQILVTPNEKPAVAQENKKEELKTKEILSQ